MPIKNMTDLNLTNKKVLMRQDLNVPIKDGKVVSDIRIKASLPTIKKALAANASVIVMSHLGRPVAGQFDQAFSLAPVAKHMANLLHKPVRLEKNWLDGITIKSGEIVLCENVRFALGEKENAIDLGHKMAALCDIFVMDAFGSAHRTQASTCRVAEFAPIACAGLLLQKELTALGQALSAPVKPLVAIVGGSKVSTKLTLLESLSSKVDQLIAGGGIANTFIKATGLPIGKSLYEANLIEQAKSLMANAQTQGGKILVPTDVVCAQEPSASATATVKQVTDVAANDMILDIGPKTAQQYAKILQTAGTIVWNGPVGVFELDQFDGGTRCLAKAIAASQAFSIAGGGDTLAAIDKYGIADHISYTSTGGGAFLEFLEGKELPAVAMLKQRSL